MDVIVRFCCRRTLDESERAIACAWRGDVEYFNTVAPEILLNARDEYDTTVLTVAAFMGHLDCCEVIVERCTPLLYLQGYYKWSVLHWVAAYHNNLENIMRFLITADSEADLEDGGGAKLPNKRLLTMQDKWGRTDLHLAVERENHWATKLLLQADADFELRRMVDEKGRTCLHLAANKGDHVTAELILTPRPDNEFLKMTKRHSKQTALHIAVQRENLAIVQMLLEADHSNDLLAMIDSHQKTALHIAVDKAAAHGGSGSVSEDICKLLLEKDPGQCTKQTGEMGWTLLHLAASHGLSSLAKYIVQLRPDCINAVDFLGRNVLHIAAYHGHPNAVKHFLESKDTDVVALLNTKDKDGNTPLHLAVSKGNVEVVSLMLQAYPTSIHITNISQQTPYMMAMEKILSDEYDEARSESDSKIIRMLLEKDPEQCKIRIGDMEWTYLHRVTSRGNLSIIKDIIELCPDCLKLEDTHKQTFIHIAAKHEFVDVVKLILESKEIENTMLNAQDKDGNTPLHIAAINKNQKAALFLLYDARVRKEIENDKKEKATDLIPFSYAVASQRDLKDQSSFDLVVAALIATVSFTAGITVPGGYVSDGANKGSAILLKATAFKVFVISNSFALLSSLYTIFLNFSTRRLLKEEDIHYEYSTGTFNTRLLLKKKDMIYQLNMATHCTLSAVYAMVVAFTTGSYAVLANSDGLAITVCVGSFFFLILASRATWNMARQYWGLKPVPEVSS